MSISSVKNKNSIESSLLTDISNVTEDCTTFHLVANSMIIQFATIHR